MLYEYQCTTCETQIEARRSIAERNNCPHCPNCGGDTEKRIFTPSMNQFPEWNISYKCVATGEEITSLAQRKRIMKDKNLVDAAEFGQPNLEKMAVEREEMFRSANQEQEIPAELKEAMVREKIEF